MGKMSLLALCVAAVLMSVGLTGQAADRVEPPAGGTWGSPGGPGDQGVASGGSGGPIVLADADEADDDEGDDEDDDDAPRQRVVDKGPLVEKAPSEKPLVDKGQLEKPAADQGDAKYGFLGVAPGEMTAAMAERLGLADGRGVVAQEVEKDSPADKAGIRRGDVLTVIDDQVLYSVDQLRKLVSARKPGTVAKVQLVRKGGPETVKVDLGGTASRPWWRAMGLAPAPWAGMEWPPDMGPRGWERMLPPGTMRPGQPGGLKTGGEWLKELESLKDDIAPKVWAKIRDILLGEGQAKPPAGGESREPRPGGKSQETNPDIGFGRQFPM